jgi:IS1 family transposase
MNRLSTEQRARIIGCLVEGNSIRATCRLTGAAKGTVTKLIIDLGEACSAYQDKTLRNLTCERIQLDEIWSFVGAKKKNVDPERHNDDYGDAWTFTALDPDTKLVPSWFVGARTADDAWEVLTDLRGRLANRVQMSTDGHEMYLTTVPEAFEDDIDYAQVVKHYGRKPADPANHRYSPAPCVTVTINKVSGAPDPAHISTSLVERQNLTIRMSMRRFTRLTNAFSKKLGNLTAAVSLHFCYYNFARPHMALTRAANHVPTTPAMAAGVADHVWTLAEIAVLLDHNEHSVGNSN